MLTFRTHPLARVRPESVPPAIMGEDAEKFSLMEELGVKAVLSLEFSSRLASMSPEEFIGELCSSCLVAQIAVGEDWHFGRGRAFSVSARNRWARMASAMQTAVTRTHRQVSTIMAGY